MVAIVLVNFVLFDLFDIAVSGGGFGSVFVGIVCGTGTLALQLLYFGRPAARGDPRICGFFLVVQVLLAYAPLLLIGQNWLNVPGFLAGGIAIVARPWVAAAAFVAVASSVGLILGTLQQSPLSIGYEVLATLITGLVVYGLTRLATTASELQNARAGLARTAVSRERLRFARDLHDLLGLSLSAITLKSELIGKLLRRQPARARAELADVRELSRQTLVEVRSVVSGFRELAFDEEYRSALSVLAAAGVEVDAVQTVGELPPQAATVLATVLREGVTNMLRHSRPNRCEIAVVAEGSSVRLELVNDGAPEPAQDERHSSGIASLADRLAALGGTLDAGHAPDRRFRLAARLPVGDHASRRGERPAAAAAPVPTVPVALRPVQALAAGVFLGFGVAAAIRVAESAVAAPTAVAGFACLGVLLAAQQVFVVRPGLARSTVGIGLLALQGVLVYLPKLVVGPDWVSLPGLFAGTALLVLRRPTGAAVFAVTVLAEIGFAVVRHAPPESVVFAALAVVNPALVTFGLTWLVRMVAELHAARVQLAEAAVAEQRLRFASEIDEGLGVSLSAMILASDRAARLAAQASVEATESAVERLQDLSRAALRDVRLIAHGYLPTSLAAEARTAESVLAAADISARIVVATAPPLPAPVEGVLASALREGVTNLLRHSDVTTCEISLRRAVDTVDLELSNDGVSGRGGAELRGGLSSLADRIDELGGTLAVEREEGWFRLRVRLPLDAPADALVDVGHRSTVRATPPHARF